MTGQNNHIIRTDQLNYRYGDGSRAINDLTIGFQARRSTALLGANGAGKSTLFLLLNGILRPTSGKVYYNGQPYQYHKNELVTIKKNVGIVFQDPDDQLFSGSVTQDISFGAFNLGYDEKSVRKKVNDVLEVTGISHLADKPTHMLSYGQKKRVAIAGVVVMSPQVIILDEPTAGLDPKGVRQIMGLMMRLKEELGLTIIMSTHDVDIVPEYADDVHIIKMGKHIASGTVDQVFSQPDMLRRAELDTPRITQLCQQLSSDRVLNLDRYAHTVRDGYQLIKRALNRE